MRAKVVTSSGDSAYKGIWIQCPGCKEPHVLTVSRASADQGKGPYWTWNGSLERPTFTPSLLVYEVDKPDFKSPRCHSYITDGRIQFLGDSTHALVGQVVDLPELDGPAPGGAKGEP